MKWNLPAALAAMLLLVLSFGAECSALAAEPEAGSSAEDTPDSLAPSIPTLEQIESGTASIENFVPMNFDFRIGVVADFEQVNNVEGVDQTRIYTPFVSIDPRTGRTAISARNFPARVVANSPDGRWVVAIAASSAVEGTSGSASREAGVLLNLETGDVTLIQEFPLHSNFQALFTKDDSKNFYYCINEPGALNLLQKYTIETKTSTPLPVEGNRFYLYGIRETQPQAVWTRDPLSTESYPVLSLLDLQNGARLASAEFPSANEVIAQPGGEALMSAVRDTKQASIAYYQPSEHVLHQVPGVVLARPSFKWLHSGLEIIAKENAAYNDRFVRINLQTGETTELFSAKFKISYWDVSPDDKAIIFVTDTNDNPVLFVLSLDPQQPGMNRIKLRDMKNIRWIGCLHPYSSGGSLLDRLIPKF